MSPHVCARGWAITAMRQRTSCVESRSSVWGCLDERTLRSWHSPTSPSAQHLNRPREAPKAGRQHSRQRLGADLRLLHSSRLASAPHALSPHVSHVLLGGSDSGWSYSMTKQRERRARVPDALPVRIPPALGMRPSRGERPTKVLDFLRGYAGHALRVY